ncbi:MAG: SpoVA/SpoVAEb family sporulation membrane protein [Lachnospiraceae bacterium]
MIFFNAFWVGGLICMLVQILMEKTKLMPGRIMVLLVCTGIVLSFIGVYEPLLEYAGAGVSVPLLGFGNILMKGVKKAIIEEGFLGLFSGGFVAGAVGCSGALIFGYIASLIYRVKRRKNVKNK